MTYCAVKADTADHDRRMARIDALADASERATKELYADVMQAVRAGGTVEVPEYTGGLIERYVTRNAPVFGELDDMFGRPDLIAKLVQVALVSVDSNVSQIAQQWASKLALEVAQHYADDVAAMQSGDDE